MANTSSNQEEKTFIIDCIPFNGDKIISLRLNSTYPHVDEIIIVESYHTFNGKRKQELYFQKYANLFKPFSDKITFLPLQLPPEILREYEQIIENISGYNRLSFLLEQFQRDYPLFYVESHWMGKNFMLISSDCDEIPNKDFLSNIGNLRKELWDKSVVYMEMPMFYYNFNWMKRDSWIKAFAISDIVLFNSTQTHGLEYYRIANAILYKRRLE